MGSARPITCPRCDYDLSGVVAAWKSCCPVDGMCSECGLRFAWRDLIGGRMFPRWSFEHALRRHAWCAVRTALLTLRPGRMWRRLAMWHEIHWMRLVVFVCAAGAVLHLLVAAAVFAECWLNPEAQWGPSWRGASGLPYFGPGNFDPFTAAVTGLWPYRITIGGWSNDWVWVHPAAAHAILAFLLVPLAFWALPQTLRRARVHRRHVLRVWLYSLVPLPLVLAVWGGGVWMFTHLFTTLNALVYELTGLAIFDDEPTFYLRCQEYVSEHDGAVLTVLVGVWLWWWWSMAVGRYLRLPRPWAVGAAMVVIAGLAGGLLLMIIPSVGGLWLERVWG